MRRERIQLPPDPSRAAPVNPELYKKIAHVGSGSYGNIFQARKNGETFAIKTHKNIPTKAYSSEQIRTRLINELMMLSSGVMFGKVDCPYIIKLRDWYVKNDQYAFVMDYHPTDLHKLLGHYKYGVMSEETAKFFLAEIVLALEAVHNINVVHNDLKPENILIDSDGHAILTDFGIAELNIRGKVWGKEGTPVYMAPESLRIKGHDRQADWWSFGVMMFEILTGYLPFEGHTSPELIKIQKKPISYPEHVSKEAVDLIKRLLNRNPDKRISNNLQNIKSHPFFAGIDWKSLERREVESPLTLIDECNNNCESHASSEKRKRREDSGMFSRMKKKYEKLIKKKRFVQSVPQSPERKCKSARAAANRQRFSFRSLVPRFSTGHSTNSNSTPKSGCNV